MNRMYVVMTKRYSGSDLIHGLFTCYTDAARTLETEVPAAHRADSYVVRLLCNSYGQKAVIVYPRKN